MKNQLIPAATPITETFSTSMRTYRSLPLKASIIFLFSLSLIGCSTQNSSWPKTYSLAEEAAIASDVPRVHRAPCASEATDYDPWESFNALTFSFNFNVLDRYGLKPAAKVWAWALPIEVRHGLGNVFDNIGMPRRFVNKVLQGRWPGAGEELARFVLNSTIGVVGFIDVAARLGIRSSDADTGQTLGVYGVKPGPYLVLPILPPLTVRDAVGYAADSFMDPLSYFVTPVFADIGRSAAYMINERADDMTEYDDVEDTSLDLYAAVRNGFLQRRQKSIKDAIRDRDRFWGISSSRFDQSESSFDVPNGALFDESNIK